MDTVALRTFVEVCRIGSISGAAAALGYSQSAVSRQVAVLEREVGHPLVERLPRGVRTTVHGEAFLGHARVAVRELERAVEAARDATTTRRRRVNLGAVPSATASLVPRAMTRLARTDPDVTVSLTGDLTPRLLDRLVAEELDLVVVTDYPPGLPDLPGVRFRHLLDEEVHLVVGAGHRLARTTRRRVRWETLDDESWVEDNAGSAAVLHLAAARAGFVPRAEYDVRGLLSKLALVASGHGIALVPGLMVPGLRPDVVVRRLADPPTRGVYAGYRHATAENESLLAALDAEVTG
ncbi:LysR family transcriptional regulator [Luteipulveratus flavus]|uniref:LysR family transcriptional regulator n=1 Tax=Luteipulveratus flavus TaxID=3031728 RepID=A0ABT6C3P4_9MICO|nr:LysR family transcriptional regulator [Luteipulveratus sp. YIM 133296]MDF8263566.1 LysR family transcriptional regulator [Luteipulveratus sp. YIM 133296]